MKKLIFTALIGLGCVTAYGQVPDPTEQQTEPTEQQVDPTQGITDNPTQELDDPTENERLTPTERETEAHERYQDGDVEEQEAVEPIDEQAQNADQQESGAPVNEGAQDVQQEDVQPMKEDDTPPRAQEQEQEPQVQEQDEDTDRARRYEDADAIKQETDDAVDEETQNAQQAAPKEMYDRSYPSVQDGDNEDASKYGDTDAVEQRAADQMDQEKQNVRQQANDAMDEKTQNVQEGAPTMDEEMTATMKGETDSLHQRDAQDNMQKMSDEGVRDMNMKDRSADDSGKMKKKKKMHEMSSDSDLGYSKIGKNQLPSKVRDAIDSKYPDASVQKIHRNEQGEYKIEVKTTETLHLDKDGKPVNQ
ncbi:PepSY-like domain-containing protein [Pricia sp. S334]|uniref:PepSY-like domain-containing protein n=1 Tax=Pricia mediterranea TaxID=3076079 RepID=A0ABU3L319_9FLAO|nr:PepSY-like domain-containing protein [Pricia sp. S334]MDT7827589.1 PepSY-like domain-containing protein [Pricia sp. S334]